MKTGISCAVLLCLMGSMAGAAASGNIAGSIESDPIDFVAGSIESDPIDFGGGLGWGSVFASHIVAAPTHGALVMNADGTFSYTPDLNYFGADSFSYNLSDGPLDSNLATVSLTVTPVNDAPVAADVALATAEDTK